MRVGLRVGLGVGLRVGLGVGLGATDRTQAGEGRHTARQPWSATQMRRLNYITK